MDCCFPPKVKLAAYKALQGFLFNSVLSLLGSQFNLDSCYLKKILTDNFSKLFLTQFSLDYDFHKIDKLELFLKLLFPRKSKFHRFLNFFTETETTSILMAAALIPGLSAPKIQDGVGEAQVTNG